MRAKAMSNRISMESSFLPEPGVWGLPLAAIGISLRDRVEAGGVERVAAGEAAQAQPDAAQDPVKLHGFHHVDRAGRFKTAGGGKQGREKALVETETGDGGVNGYALHRSKSLVTSVSISANGICEAARRRLNTMR
jgi:hypothetical protein